jgi:lysozyme
VRISDTGLALVQAFEGCLKPVPGKPGHFKPYIDPVGVLTIGWGHTNHHEPKFTSATVWSEAQCDAVLRADLGTFERHVEALVKVPLVQHEFDALVSWAYNTGGPATATLWKKLNAGNKAAVPAELAKWNKGGGKVLAGLVRRRKAEGLLFDGRIDEAMQVAGARRPPLPLARQPAEIVAPAQSPPDIEPAISAAPKRGWLALLVHRFRKAS